MKQSFSRSSRIFLLIVAFFFSTAALAQAPPTVEQALQSRGISENLESIRSALTDSRADVRGLAASVLAERNDRESIRPIQQLLAKSSSNYERQNLSQALLKFGDKEGNRGMKALCEDESVQEDLRLIAANQLHEANDNGCLPAVIKMLSATTSVSTTLGCLDFLKHNSAIPAASKSNLRPGLERSLKSEDASTRKAASECIARFILKDLADALRRALFAERDTAVREQMQLSLNQLEAGS